MNYFDLHCDTLSRIENEGLKPGSRKLQVNLKKISDFKKYSQCFAVWIDDNYHAENAFLKADRIYKSFKETVEAFLISDSFKQYLTLENAVYFSENLDYVNLWKRRGAIMASLTWNGENALAGGALSYGRLTKLGAYAVAQMESCGICLDVSHLNFDSFDDVKKVSRKPFVASHSNCFSICENKRNLKDKQLLEIIERGGLIGICFYPAFLGKGDIFENIYRHICHVLKLGGENCLSFGSDFDGALMDKKLDEISKVVNLYDFLKNKGFDDNFLEKIFYKNAENFFKRVLQVA